MLRRHTQGCEPCAAFVENTVLLTQLLRKAPLERFASQIVVTQRRHRPRVLRTASVLAAACVVIATAGITVSREMRYQSSPYRPPSPIEQRLVAGQADGSGAVHLHPVGLPLPVVQRSARHDF